MPKQKTIRSTADCERCWVLLGQHRPPIWFARRYRPTTGTVATVEFDGPWVLAREERRGDVIGFLHTHPGASADPSTRDLRTMRAWTASFGKPLLCVILSSRTRYAGVFVPGRDEAVRLVALELFGQHVVGVEAHGRPVSP